MSTSGPPPDFNHDVPYGPYEQIILFGDSITQMASSQTNGFAFAPALQDDYARQLDVINRGFGGYNSENAIAALPRFFPTPAQAKVRFMMICLGANDACLPDADATHHVGISDYRQNLKDIINHPVVQAHSPRILLITPPPVNEHQLIVIDRARGHGRLRHTANNTKIYATACKEVGEELGVPVVDIWTACLISAGWESGDALVGSMEVPENEIFTALFSDGLHLLPGGYRIIYSEVKKAIAKHWPEDTPERLSFVFPSWEFALKKI